MTYVIAEMGSTHDGDLDQARALVDVASQAGANACKAQFWSSAARLAARRRAPDYLAIYARYQMPRAWLDVLADRCARLGLDFLCTAYLPEDIPVIAPFVAKFKIASFEAGDSAFIRAHVPYGKPILVSTGMMSGQSRVILDDPQVRFLHCVSAYPTPLDQANLGVLQQCGYDREPIYAGYSDHTRHVLTGALAVAAGAQVLEVHYRLDGTDRRNPDFAAALRPLELAEYIRLVRIAEMMLGDGQKKPQPAEAAMQPYRVQEGTP